MQTALYAIYAVGTFLAGAGAWSNRRKVRKLEGKPPFRALARCQTERDNALADNARLRAECRRLLAECTELKKALQEALREITRLTG